MSSAAPSRWTGDAMISRTQSSYIRAPSLAAMMQVAPAWSTQSLNPRRSANMFAVDGRETWLIHNYLRPDEGDFAAVDRDRCIRLILGVGIWLVVRAARANRPRTAVQVI